VVVEADSFQSLINLVRAGIGATVLPLAPVHAMVAAGETTLTEVYVVAGSPMPVSPCGGCRQKLAEFGSSDVRVTMGTTAGPEQVMTLGELLPGAFNADHIGEK